jgi:hypothetical protein
LVDPLFNITPLLNWTVIEPGLYLIAACALSFKPLFRMIARALHLSQLVTYTMSSFGGGKTWGDRKTNATSIGGGTVIRMDAFKSGSSGGFTKLGEGKDGEVYAKDTWDLEAGLSVQVGSMQTLGHQKADEEGVINVLVTRTMAVESESWYGESDDEDDGEFKVAVDFDKRVIS